MQEGEHRNTGSTGAWQQVGMAFASRVADGAQRVVEDIRRRVVDSLPLLSRRPRLPLWLPDYSAFTGALWAERLVSRVYDTLSSLAAIPREMPSSVWAPGQFVWLRPSGVSAALWREDEDAEAPLPLEAIDSAGGEAGPVEGATPAGTGWPDGAWRPAEVRPRPRRGTGTEPLTGIRRISPAVPLQRLRRPGGAVARGGVPADDVPELHARDTHATGEAVSGRVHEERPIGAVPFVPAAARVGLEGAATRGLVRAAEAFEAGAAEAPPDRSRSALAAVERTVEFSHRMAAKPRQPLVGEGVAWPAAPESGAPVEPAAAMALPGDAAVRQPLEPGGSGRVEPTMAVPPPGGERRWLPLIGMTYQNAAAPAEPMGLAAEMGGVAQERCDVETEVWEARPQPHAVGGRYGGREMAASSAELIHASLPAPEAASPAELAARAFVPMEDRPPGAQWEGALPDGHASPRALQPGPSGALMAGEAAALGGGSRSAGASHGLAFALVGRSTAGDDAATAPVAEEVAGGMEGGGEEQGPNIDRLAREVYAVLKRRLAWERERSLASRA
ncbi:MAG: hypothetical protein SVP26_10220 [Chloroflexota bacterium]|nr:hypothetical protein [Chloroflexota bacterium]